jgi:adenosine deaminase
MEAHRNGKMPLSVFEALPKTDLHVHLDGSLRLDTMLELAEQDGVELPAADAEGLKQLIGCGRCFG